MGDNDYVHGYSDKEQMRLCDQAGTLEDLLHHDTHYPAGCTVLEAGCGVGAQTLILGKSSPGARITSIDISPVSLDQARETALKAGLENVEFSVADIYDLPFDAGLFDHVFVCFVLEHLARPADALRSLRRVLKPGGTITVIEGDHGSCSFYPESPDAAKAISCLVGLQARAGGDALIGRRLFPLLSSAGFEAVAVSPRLVYVDASRPGLVDGFTRKTFTAMVEGVKAEAMRAGMMDESAWAKGIAGLYRTTEADGVFCYTFFKATAVKP